ncbi:branched-chain amino acid ABC transporter substrate-binding protein [Paenibacillus hunanensis]|uniref:Branched-chain amino acid transport system substrate-binding protein n=1 Tax=Paenibacillus hunanensis TaxID=539262 RepID=A0ABU1IXS5_9BACL|nr:branched-chain amino acid ABC transporter substrate-binding protein [Paenibacillus hunanensis]MCL9661228.1 branched-chain amino acid ABC transporter substrate-binding protein [Paenibacillus hunanensis]MDR6243800.1 branched-chain amino acid transport system substrate-binding protein [Paenibacillus hunanensis]GGJ24927.1 branched chain amino acid ABC transporter substrate-binding protein [Paenibacillus hunanensis]
MKWKWNGLVAATLIMGLLAGCGNGGTSTTTGASGSGGSSSGKVIKIATQSPLSGGSSIQGEAIRLGAQMSLEDHKEEFTKLGYSLELVPYDDQGDPKKGVANAEQIGADQAVLGVIGHLNSGVSIPSSVVYEKYNIPMISPASTATEFTDRKLKVANRVVARDDFQGPAAANYAVKTVGAKKIFVIQDKTAYGQGLAEAFRDEAQKLGATIVGYEGITVGEKDFNGVLNIAATQNPDFIFFGGLYAEGGLIIKQARDKGITAPIMGGDALDSSGLVEVAGPDVKGALYSSVAGEIAKMEGGPEWGARYQKAFGKAPEGYSAYAYDSMTIMLDAIKKTVESNKGEMPTREAVRDAVRATKDFKGIATEVTFDDKGDNSFAKVYIYEFKGDTYPGELVSEVSQ